MEIHVKLNNIDEQKAICGNRDKHAKTIRKLYGVVFVLRDGHLKIVGDDEAAVKARNAVQCVLDELREKGGISEARVDALIQAGSGRKGNSSGRLVGKKGPIDLPPHVWPRSKGQEKYIRKIADHEITFGIGPAGTGKTYLAVAMAITSLKAGLYKKMILTRPAVEAGEKLGFLPGDYQAKVNPYLRPLYDAIESFLEPGKVKRSVESDVIEVIPLAYMRGRSLDNAFIILDEAQNTTPMQMKMFLTRMGKGAKIVVTGDITQIDLPENQVSGLVHTLEILKGVKGIGRVFLTKNDIVRHRMVQRIVSAYNRVEKRS